MIPLTMIPWRAIGAAAIVATVAVMGWRVSVWHQAYGELRATQARLELEESCGGGSKCRARETALREELSDAKDEVVADLQAELDSVRNRPARVVRVCPGAGNVPLPGTSPGSDGTAAGTGELPGSAGPDIGPSLYGLAREADEIVARCRALQAWNKALSAQP